MLPTLPISIPLFFAAIAVIATAIARHPGSCAYCNDPIVEGEIIAYSEESEAWCHEGCCEDPEGDDVR